MGEGVSYMSDQDEKRLRVGIIGSGAANMHMLAAMAGAEPGQRPIIDPIDQEPVIKGAAGKAWLCDLAAGLRSLGCVPEDDATLAHWIVEAPGYHPVWHSYSIVVGHLRPLREPRETLFYLDGATHEIWVYAMNPEADRRSTLATGIVKDHWLHPGNYVGQFIEVSDDLARDRVRQSVQDICDGKLSPDTDYVSRWKVLYGDHMFKDREKRITPKRVFA
jgi:hypothetical protein